jgi:hypothetical protein
MICTIHKGRIKGQVHYWNHRPMCPRCYGYFTKRVMIRRAPKPKTRRSSDGGNNGSKTLLKKLLRLLD